ncbi:pilus assembly protein [Stenotrophomonas humi]|uniref:Pilus assembly protein n=1 Tax=Stenotrophomonas humi TaxID=405444 RepID=A0A0R0C274_9GAMM|nr:fimbria/pilus periplasmic chaperone [Stenotrophomonas humi]KRG63568.1 pilus assembly protein [Stenotrophomonas humi]
MNHGIRKLMVFTLVALSTIALQAQASVVIEGTRVIFPGQGSEVTVKLKNVGNHPALVQSWLDDGDAAASPETLDVPFILTPAMFRLDPSNAQTLRLIHTGAGMANDKETLYWLNVLEVPPKSHEDANRLQLAIRTRIKMMYRPPGLPGLAADAPKAVRWELVRNSGGKGYALKGSNPTAYFVNLGKVKLSAGAVEFDAGAGHIAPGDMALFPIGGLENAPSAPVEVHFSALNDWGSAVPGTQALAASAPN